MSSAGDGMHVLRDACPRCRRVALPWGVRLSGKGWIVARYYCWGCGNSWMCNFLKDAVPVLVLRRIQNTQRQNPAYEGR